MRGMNPMAVPQVAATSYYAYHTGGRTLPPPLPAPPRLPLGYPHLPYHTAPEPAHPSAAFPLPGSGADHPLIAQARKLLPILATISAFGASLAFGTFFTAQQTYPKDSRALVYLAWSFVAFVCGMLSTLIWQVVLGSDFRGFDGRLFRSKAAILLACFAAFLSIAAGMVLLGLSFTEGTAPSVRAAGLASVILVVIAVFFTMIRLCMTIARRGRASRQRAPPPPQSWRAAW